MSELALHAGLRALSRPRGGESLDLRLGEFRVRIEGLDRDLAGSLRERWGGFVVEKDPARPDTTLRLFRGETDAWLRLEQSGETYRVEAVGPAGRRVVLSYHFAICAEDDPGAWRVAVAEQSVEPLPRVIDNATRFAMARLALDRGGFAMHAAGVLHRNQAFFFAGPSGSGKTTAVSLAAPAVSLGDDFAVVLPGPAGWRAPALPFDNSERIRHAPPRGWHPVAAIWRLHKANETRTESLPTQLAVASLIGCTAFSQALPDQAERTLEQAGRYVAEGSFARLHFRKDAALLSELLDKTIAE